MPTKKKQKGNEAAALQPDDGITVPRLKLSEQGFTGLRVSHHRILDESIRAFQYPYFITTVNEMRHNPTVGSAMNVYKMMISRVNWCVEADEDADDIDKQRAEILETMMHDMDGSWKSFIEEVVPYLEYGFDIHEKVFRRRLYRFGSKYNDGLIGLKKLAPRNQDTIQGWVFSEDGGELVGVQQSLSFLEKPYLFLDKTDSNGYIPIDRDKFLLFTASGTKGNPQGNSLYKAIYLAYKQLTLLQEQELVGAAKDVQGILKIEVPPEYLSADVSPAIAASAAAFQKIIDNYNAGKQRGLLVPNMTDSESKTKMFDYSLMESKGTAKYDLEVIIKRLQSDILSALNVDILKLGAEGSGSFSLAESKTSVLALAVDYRLREIQEVLNNDLIPSLYRMNGWSLERLPKFVYEDVEQISLEEFSKAVQRIFAVGAIEADRPVMNRVREVFGVEPLPEDEPVDKDKLPANMGMDSNAGEGMAVGTTGNGTAKNANGQKNSSTANKENT